MTLQSGKSVIIGHTGATTHTDKRDLFEMLDMDCQRGLTSFLLKVSQTLSEQSHGSPMDLKDEKQWLQRNGQEDRGVFPQGSGVELELLNLFMSDLHNGDMTVFASDPRFFQLMAFKINCVHDTEWQMKFSVSK